MKELDKIKHETARVMALELAKSLSPLIPADTLRARLDIVSILSIEFADAMHNDLQKKLNVEK